MHEELEEIGDEGDEMDAEFVEAIDEMDACHILLGRPWLFDRNVQHTGRQNTYSFIWHNKKIVLLPPTPPGTTPHKTSRDKLRHPHQNLLGQLNTLSATQDSSQYHNSHALIALILKVVEMTESNITIPPTIQPLLEEYSDLSQTDLSNELPPLRDLQHNIDLLSDASLPNLPHYRMSPKEHAILQGIVDDLLPKNLVHPSLSSCAVPTLLVSKKDKT
nr:uncharacterized protein LOC112490622 [Ziziphus jujuba var. spinosa]